MKKLLAVIVAALMLGSFAVTASAADLANYAKDATATEWTAGETEGTQTLTYDLGGIKPLGYFQITWGENVPAAFTVATSSDNSSFADQYTTTDNAAAVTEIEVAAATSRYVKITITGEGSYEVKELIVRKTKDEVDTSADAKYPSSGVSVPDGSVVIKGTVLYASRANSSVTKQVGAETLLQALPLHSTATSTHSLTRSEQATASAVWMQASLTFSQRLLFTPETLSSHVSTALLSRVPTTVKNGQTSG